MKQLFLYSLLSVLLLASCTTEEPATADNQEVNLSSRSVDEFCYETPLIAGRHIEVGQVQLVYVNGEVQVQYITNGDWTIQETHLYAGACADMPVNRGGNPKIGRFPMKGSHANGTQMVTYALDVNNLPECVCIAAHAVVKNSYTNQRETAWAEGESFPGRNWAMFFNYCLDTCDGD